MFLFPQNALSLVSLVLFFVFFQSGLFFLYFYIKVSRPLAATDREHLFFALMSFAQALNSFGAAQLYSAPDSEVGMMWQRFQWFSGILLFVFFVCFTTDYLKVKFRFLFWTVILPAFFFAPAALFWSEFLTHEPALKTFKILRYVYEIHEVAVGPVATVAGLWIALHLVFLLGGWFLYFGRRRRAPVPAFALVGLTFFILTAFNEILVQAKFYEAPYFLEYGFLFFSVAFYFQFILDFFGLYETNLLRSQELARLHDESRFFISTVSHDLKAPLMSIEGFATLLKEDFSDAFKSKQASDYLHRISKNAGMLMQRVTELKNFVNIGTVREEVEPIVLSEFVPEVLKSFEPALKGVKVELSLPPDLEQVRFCRRRLQDLLMNLIDNAVKYGKGKQAPILKIQVRRADGETVWKVEDNGPGIPFEHQEKVFDLFYRASDDSQGTGIGLAAVKKIITQAGGRVWVESEVGGGSRFFFTLPE